MDIIEKLGITKGPWESAEFRYRGVNKVHTHEIHYGSDAECVAEYVAVKEDANLISAAPELLEVVIELMDCSEYWSEYYVPLGIHDRIKNAVEKATGRTASEVMEMYNE